MHSSNRLYDKAERRSLRLMTGLCRESCRKADAHPGSLPAAVLAGQLILPHAE